MFQKVLRIIETFNLQVTEDVRQCVEHWIAEGWCGVAEEEIYDEQGNAGLFLFIINIYC